MKAEPVISPHGRTSTLRLLTVAVVVAICASLLGACGEDRAAESLNRDARAYLDAVASGDARTALAMTAPAARTQVDEHYSSLGWTLFDDERVLAGAVEFISDAHIDNATAHGAHAGHVDVTFTLAGRSEDAVLLFQQSDSHWTVTQGLIGVVDVEKQLDGTPIPFTVSSVDAPITKVGTDGTSRPISIQALFTAVYRIDVDTDLPLISHHDTEQVDGGPTTSVKAVILPEGGAELKYGSVSQ